MIQIRLSADSMEELAAAKKRMQGLFTVYRLKGSEEPKNGHYKAYLVADVNSGRGPRERREQRRKPERTTRSHGEARGNREENACDT